jgi:hypothetical protein
MARQSRPPGFDMTYRPEETVFGPPVISWIPSIAYLTAALAVWILVLFGERSAVGTWAFEYVVQEDAARFMSIRTFGAIILVSALGSLVRAGMRGVRIYPDGVEARDVLNFIVPKLRRYRWPQIERIIFDGRTTVAFDLWDGSRAFLPKVSDRAALVEALERIARARAIPMRGASEVEDVAVAPDEDGDPPGDE